MVDSSKNSYDIIEIIVRKISTARNIGIRRVVASRYHMIVPTILRYIYRFDAWHSTNPYSIRPYKKHVVSIINSINPHSIVEVGCGLGDIISRSTSKIKYGVDSDARVLRAAKLIHGKEIKWICGDLVDLDKLLPPGKLDCIVMIGWLHMLSEAQLKEIFKNIGPKFNYFLLDSFVGDLPPGCFRHEFGFLNNCAECISESMLEDDRIRKYLLFRKNN